MGLASMRSTLFCFDVKGMRQWAFTPEEANTWVRMATRLADGRFLIGVYHAGLEGEEATTLFEWDTGRKDDPAQRISRREDSRTTISPGNSKTQ